MNDFKDLDLDYFAPRKPAEPEAKPEKPKSEMRRLRMKAPNPQSAAASRNRAAASF